VRYILNSVLKSKKKMFFRRSAVIGLSSCLMIFFVVDSYASPLGPQRSLRKLSRKLQAGLDPSVQDQAQLQQIVVTYGASSKEVKTFFELKANEYVESLGFRKRLMHKLQNLLRFSTFVVDDKGLPVVSSNLGTDPILKSQYAEALKSSTYNIIKDVVDNNQPWDTLLTGKKYSVSDNAYFTDPKGSTSFYEDSFYEKVMSSNVSTSNGVLEFKPEEDKIAGILTSTMYRARFHASKSNENRRIAQSVFRAFMCDDLQPAFVPSTDEDQKNVDLLKDIIGKLKGGSTPPTPDEIQDVMNANNIKHGTEASCMACHFKLDPMGQVFGTPGEGNLEAKPFAGGLVFSRHGQEIKIPVTGIGGLAQALVTQPEYNQCQSNHFWNWFVGSEVSLSDKRKSDLADVFTGKKTVNGVSIAKNPRKFAAYIVKQPEFFTDINSLDPNSPEAMATLLQSCNSCHSAVGRPTFTSRPFGGSLELDAQLVASLKKRVLELPMTDPQSMPPNRASWSDADLARLKSWVTGLVPMTTPANGGN
jgi:hypothetical protein